MGREGMRRMRLRGETGHLQGHPREGAGADQAAALAALLCLAALAGCAIPKEINPIEIYREVTGLADEERLPPPGLDQPFPNLATVPPRPERPPAALREAITAGLAADRAEAREPVMLRTVPAPAEGGAASPGRPAVPSGPPPRPALTAAPPVPWTEPAAPARRAGPAPAAPPPGQAAAGRAGPRPAESVPDLPARAPTMPEAAPAPPPAELLAPGAPPPLPPQDLLAPPRAR